MKETGSKIENPEPWSYTISQLASMEKNGYLIRTRFKEKKDASLSGTPVSPKETLKRKLERGQKEDRVVTT